MQMEIQSFPLRASWLILFPVPFYFLEPDMKPSSSPRQADLAAPPEFDLARDIHRCSQAYRRSLLILCSLTSITTLSVAAFVALIQ